MLGNQKNISIRLSVTDGEKVRKELSLTGDMGERAMRRIKEATAPASKSLSAINIVAEQAHYGMINLAGGAGTLGLNLARLGPIGTAAAASLGAFFLGIKAGLKELHEAEEALNHLQAALQATDFASGVTAREIEGLGEALERTTLFKKEDIEKAAANLTSFGNIQDEVFKRALRLSADLAVRLGTDVPSAADALGKALERPEEGLGRLARKVSDLSFTQKESIEAFIRQGDVASAQAVIFEHLESKIHGLAEAQTKGMAGSINRFSDVWGNFLERLGKTELAQGSVNMLTHALRGLSNAIDPDLTEKAAKLEEQIARLQNTIAVKMHQGVGGEYPLLTRKKKELAQIKAEIAAQEAAGAAEKARAKAMAKEAADARRSNQLMELAQKYTKERESGWSSDQKALSEYAQRRKEILALSQGRGDEHMQQALSALNRATSFKLKGIGGKDDAKETYAAAKEELDRWKENVLKNLGEAGAANTKYAATVDEVYKTRLKEAYTQSLADSRHWLDGMTLALQKYSEEATNSAKIAEEVFTRSAHKIEDALMEIVTKGEFNLKKLGDLVKSIGDDIMRSVIRQTIVKPIVNLITNGIGGMFGGMFHEGGVVGSTPVPGRLVPADFFTTAPRLHNGLAPDEFPAILQRGEVVIPKSKVHSLEDSKSGDININFHITTPSPQAFLASRGQIMATLAGEMNRYAIRNR